MENALNLPPFPPLEWDGYFWTGTVVLPTWAGFQSRQGPYASLDSANVSDGSVSVNVITVDEGASPPMPEQAAAFGHLVEQQEAVCKAILAAVLAEYPKLQELYGYEGEEAEQLMPNIAGVEELKTRIGLHSLHIFPVAKNGLAYVGYEFGCTWDDEHGLGVMTHAGRVVEVGGADTAILQWIAMKDTAKGE